MTHHCIHTTILFFFVLKEAETRSISSTDDSTLGTKRSSASNRRRLLSSNSDVCIAANDATVCIKWPFSFAMSEIKLECPSFVSLTG